MFKNYNEFLHIEDDTEMQKKLYKGVLSHCDFDESPENEDGEEYLDIIKDKVIKDKELNILKNSFAEQMKPRKKC